MTPKERYCQKKYEEAPEIDCGCGCGKKLKSLDKYARPKAFLNGHNRKKYDDPQEHKRAWNSRNKVVRYASKKARWRMLKVKLIGLWGGKCQRCSLEYNGKNAAVFHFHHLDPSTKSFALGNQLTNKAWSTIIEEANKCEMICANCHELSHSDEF